MLDDDVELEIEPLDDRSGAPPRSDRHSARAASSSPARASRAQLRRLAFGSPARLRQDRLALGRRERAALGDHRACWRSPRAGRRTARSIASARLQPGLGRATSAGRRCRHRSTGRCTASRRARRGIAARHKLAGIGRDQRQVARIGEVDQRGFGRLLDRVAAARQLDIEPVGEQRLRAARHRRSPLSAWPSANSRASAPSPPAVSAISPSVAPSSASNGDMRILLDRPVEMRRRHQRAEIVVAGLVLGIERQPVDQRRAVRRCRRAARRRASRRRSAARPPPCRHRRTASRA